MKMFISCMSTQPTQSDDRESGEGKTMTDLNDIAELLRRQNDLLEEQTALLRRIIVRGDGENGQITTIDDRAILAFATVAAIINPVHAEGENLYDVANRYAGFINYMLTAHTVRAEDPALPA